MLVRDLLTSTYNTTPNKKILYHDTVWQSDGKLTVVGTVCLSSLEEFLGYNTI